MHLILLILYLSSCVGFEILSSLGNVADSLSSLVNKAGASTMGAFCHFKECCSEHSIHANFSGLEADLENHLFGQHLVRDVVVPALKAHWNENYHPPKALTLSFHGWPGNGKNYVANFIAKNLYKRGSQSKFVHHFVGRLHFPSQNIEKVQQYQEDLYQWLRNNVSACHKQLFIFDEVDKMPEGLLNIIKPMIDYRSEVDGVDYRHCIFIFLSNTGATLINDHFLQLWRYTGILREDLKLSHFENLITKGAFNEQGGFHLSDAIKSNLIDHYIPFLPMERIHVRLCILSEFRKRGVEEVEEEHIKEVMSILVWGPTNEQILSTTGCKRISQKVGVIIEKFYRENKKTEL